MSNDVVYWNNIKMKNNKLFFKTYSDAKFKVKRINISNNHMCILYLLMAKVFLEGK